MSSAAPGTPGLASPSPIHAETEFIHISPRRQPDTLNHPRSEAPAAATSALHHSPTSAFIVPRAAGGCAPRAGAAAWALPCRGRGPGLPGLLRSSAPVPSAGRGARGAGRGAGPARAQPHSLPARSAPRQPCSAAERRPSLPQPRQPQLIARYRSPAQNGALVLLSSSLLLLLLATRGSGFGTIPAMQKRQNAVA